ncbi:MAG: tRNA adenosine(34) deaminase TadA [Pseudomonadota bacterium]
MTDAGDEHFMRLALDQARVAESIGEVPVGAVLVADGEVMATGYNRVITDHDPTAHAEIVALRAAAQSLQNYRLSGTTLYVTLEPCAMCAGAIVHARIARLVFGATDPKAGACGSVMQLVDHVQLNHRCELTSGVLAEQAATQLKDFFRAKRRQTGVHKVS